MTTCIQRLCRVATAVLLLLAIDSAAAWGQGTGEVAGTVRNEADLHPLAGASVEIVGGGQRGVTDDSGRFVLRGVPRGEYTLRVQALGYHTAESRHELSGAREQIEVLLRVDPVLLGQILVTVDRLRQRRNAVPHAVRVMTEEQIRQHVSMSAHDVLRQRLDVHGAPRQVYLDEALLWDDVRLRGGDPRRPAWLLTLQSLPAEQIHTIEVFGNGRQVRVYTKRFMERAARYPWLIMPVIVF